MLENLYHLNTINLIETTIKSAVSNSLRRIFFQNFYPALINQDFENPGVHYVFGDGSGILIQP